MILSFLPLLSFLKFAILKPPNFLKGLRGWRVKPSLLWPLPFRYCFPVPPFFSWAVCVLAACLIPSTPFFSFLPSSWSVYPFSSSSDFLLSSFYFLSLLPFSTFLSPLLLFGVTLLSLFLTLSCAQQHCRPPSQHDSALSNIPIK